MNPAASNFPPPPKHVHIAQRQAALQDGLDPSDPTLYTRDPHRLTAYLIPFPTPDIHKGLFHAGDAKDVPTRFLIYTPPAPPLSAPAEGEKESKAHKLQRKWQEEVREAKTNPATVKSWKGIKGRVTKGVDAAMGWTTTSSIDFLNRVPGLSSSSSTPSRDAHAEDGHDEGDHTHKTVGLEEMALVYPATLTGSPAQIREEFINTMLRNKTKAQRDAILATGLLPVAFAVDILATLVWPFGGLAEIDGVWAAANIRGAKTARSVTKRLHSSAPDAAPGDVGGDDKNKLRLEFMPSARVEILARYLAAECHQVDRKYFKDSGGAPPTETEVLEAIGWAPSQTGGATTNWEDEQWETSQVKEDFAATMKKGAKEWDKWCKQVSLFFFFDCSWRYPV